MLKPSHLPTSRAASRRQRGVTLIEALVALLVMSFGMLALVGLMSNLRRGADLAKQRSEAMRLARAELTTMRTYSELRVTASTPATATTYDTGITAQAATPVVPPDSNTTYSVQRFVTQLPEDRARQIRVTVSWKDRAGDSQFINLDTLVSAVDPLFSAAVGFAPPAGPITLPSARHPAIPPGAKQLDGKISAFNPSPSSPLIWVFNNVTGVITGKCTNVSATPLSTLTAADVETCKNNTFGYLLAGVIRFSFSDPANPSSPGATALPAIGLAFSAGTYSLPRLLNGAPVMSGGSMVLDSFTDAAPSPTPDCFNDSPTTSPSTQPFVTYNCIVYPDNTTKLWSGKVELTGFPIGTTAADYRVCRYSADYNGSGGMFSADFKSLENEEHPEVYGRVTGSLARQNFLVTKGNVSCPTAPAVDPSAGVFANYSTIQLQPASP